ncbi:metal ABC transporter permease [Peptoniphilus equinus]|uniref:Metal ABC transporter permease n=1 Tax=Peptoniphilus equinus TaxID=3016343 RepID=A0ABY7QRD7_9FIRM|nr:metal ABC transporter permease [Peptoniphilus equinus]WBW49355.1 metal ABC transporter permease [Peptoniphilus equinus]
MLEFAFMRHALLAGAMLSIMIPMIGVVMVSRKTSMMGDALSHTSLSGVALGLIVGMDPVIGAIVICVVAAFAIEIIRHRFPTHGDMATAVVTSIGLGIAAVLTKFAPGGNHFESYLFGSIASVTREDVMHVAIVFLSVVFFSIALYGSLINIAIDDTLARLSGVNVTVTNGVLTALTAITIALSCKIVGALMIASILILPVATALIVSRSYKQVFLFSIMLGFIYTMLGIVLSYYYDLPTGGTIVIHALIGMAIVSLYQRRRKAAMSQ